MSGYGGRRGPNVTQYLNTLQTDSPTDDSLLDDDIALFTNTQFMEFDTGRTIDFQTPPVKAEPEQTSSSSTDDVVSSASPMADLTSGTLDFMQGSLGSLLIAFAPSQVGCSLHAFQNLAPSNGSLS